MLLYVRPEFRSRFLQLCAANFELCSARWESIFRKAYCWRRLLGKAAYLSELWALSDKAYDEAARLQPEALPAWKGLAELHNRTQDQGKIIDAYTQLVCCAVGRITTPE